MLDPFVGRAKELAVLDHAIRSVTSGVGTAIHLVGEAGIGKSSLLGKLDHRLRRSEIAVRVAVVDATDRRRPLGVMDALLGLGGDDRTMSGGDPEAQAIASVEELASAGSCALIVDDVHWCDDASLGCLTALVRRTVSLGVLIVTASRPQPSSSALARLRTVVDDVGSNVHLDPFTIGELTDLVEQRYGVPPGPGLTVALEGAGGNPFLAIELLRALDDQGRLIIGDGLAEVDGAPELPGRLVERLERRALAAVSDDGLLLRTSAVIPGGFAIEELAAALDRPVNDVTAVVMAALESAVFVDTGEMLTFRHDLLRQAVLDTTPPTIARALNRRVGQALIDRGADPVRIAESLLMGTDPRDPADRTQLVACARQARARRPCVAADLLAHALAGIGPDDRTSLPTTLELGWALLAAGRATEVAPLLEDRITAARRRDAGVELRRLEALAISLRGHLDEVTERFESDVRTHLASERDLGREDVVDAIAETALLRVSTGRLAEARELLDWVRRSPTEPSAFRRASIFTARAWLAASAGAFEEAAGHARLALSAVAEDEHRSATIGSPTLVLGIALDFLGDSAAALDAMRRSATRSDAPVWTAPLLQCGSALVLYRSGGWDDALAEADAALLAADETGFGLAVFWPYAISSLIATARGDVRTARAWLSRAGSSAAGALGTEWLVHAGAAADHADGADDRATSAMSATVDSICAADAPALLLNLGPDTIRWALANGREPVAARVRRELEAMNTRTASGVVAAIAGWAGGLVDGDHRRIVAAGDRLAGHGRAAEAARARHDAAVAAARGGGDDEARHLATQAFAAYDELGANGWHAQLRAQMRSAGLPMRPRRGGRRPERGWSSLTASENAVVALLDDGLTNTEIARRLFVSRRTVESHLGRVYGKLQLSSRAQLVAHIARRSG